MTYTTNGTSADVRIPCPGCGQGSLLTVPMIGLRAWEKGAHVQHAFPLLNADERELFISGYCKGCWDRLFDEDSETIARHDAQCSCGLLLPLQTLKSAAGYYLGHFCPDCGPYDRCTDYYATEAAALALMVD